MALTGAAAFAQQAQPTLPEAERQRGIISTTRPTRSVRPSVLSKQLNLSADQTAKVTPILADRDQKFQALMQDQSLTPEQRHQQMRAIHESTEQQLATVLTPDQLQQLKTMRHNHRRSNGPQQPERRQPGAAGSSQRPLSAYPRLHTESPCHAGRGFHFRANSPHQSVHSHPHAPSVH